MKRKEPNEKETTVGIEAQALDCPVCVEPLSLPLLKILCGEDGLIFLLINARAASSRNRLSVACIRPNSMALDFQFKLVVVDGKWKSWSVKGLVENMRKWEMKYPAKVFLSLPKKISASSNGVQVNVCICKIQS